MWRWLFRSAALAGTGLFAFVGVIGFAHTPIGHPILPYLGFLGFGHHALCPIGADRLVSDEEVEAARQKGLAPLFGSDAPGGRPALGFDLGHTTKPEVDRWASSAGASCATEPHGKLRCTDADSSREVLFVFDPTGRLVGLESSTTVADPSSAVALLAARTETVSNEAGPPTSRQGEADAEFLAAAPLRQARASFHYAGYLAELKATNVGQGRFRVSETYQSL